MAKWQKAAAIGGGIVALAGIAGAYFVRREQQVEQPGYQTLETDGAIEIRDYPSILVAEASATGDRKTSLRQGFRRLARYIFAKHRGGDLSGGVHQDEPIAMTAPVLSDRVDGGRWRTRFIMPATYTKNTLPRPGEGVAIGSIAARRVAAIRFAGIGTDETLNARERDLRLWLAKRGYTPTAAAEYAFYNSPMIPAPLRRNEVLIPITR